ncbi:MAG TPA: DUF1800 domain-containing protein [Gaiellaceae bacterium]|nr:DUF1800 domain-containing protein [Gaiellaceae bacterium]
MGAPVYRGEFGKPQAERLLWRAGFGPRPGEAEELAKLGLEGAVHRLTNPGFEKLVGPKPHDAKGRPLAPYDAWGHDHCWWLDRMVRTSRPLVERMTLVWHDWFATSNDGVGSQRLMLEQNELFRRHALGSFHDLLFEVTANPAMLVWLNGTENEKGSPNENYGREMMELFTLGADRGAYTENDVREQARALTGWTNRWSRSRGEYDFHFDKTRHDTGLKRIFRRSGAFDWRGACKLCLEHPLHPSFFATKLWSYFVPVPPSRRTLAALEAIYRDGYQVKPVVAAILMHPALYTGPRMVKPPIVHTAGLLRRIGMGITTTDWAWIGSLTGQQLFYPPNVAGWDDTRWLDTATFRGRFIAVQRILSDRKLDPAKAKDAQTADEVLARALRFWNEPALSDGTAHQLRAFARRAIADAGSADWKQKQYPVMVEQALRQLIAVSPDLQTS